jgi:hypothetical protein
VISYPARDACKIADDIAYDIADDIAFDIAVDIAEVFKVADDIADDGASKIAGERIQRSKSVLLMFLEGEKLFKDQYSCEAVGNDGSPFIKLSNMTQKGKRYGRKLKPFL